MDIAALIFAPLLLALIYSRTRIGKLPRLALVWLPVGLMTILFFALLGYAPAVQEAVATKTPLIRDFGGRIFAIYLDGLSLLFGLIITGFGALIALIASAVFEDGDAYRSFATKALVMVGLMLGFALTDSRDLFATFAAFALLACLSFINPGTREEREAAQWKQSLWFLAHMSGWFLLRMGFTVLAEIGGAANPRDGGTSELNLLISYNLSHKISYEAFFLLIFAPLISWSLYIVWRWQADKQISTPVHAFLSTSLILSSTHILARFYPAVHDNPLWWNVVTGVGLLVMLIGAVWALRQREPKGILIYRTMSVFGACVALLGLPEFIGYKVALIGIVAHALSGAALFLSLDVSRQRVRLIIVGLALLPMAIFHVLLIGVLYQVTLAWAGIALAVVMVSTALWVVSAIRFVSSPAYEMGAGIDARPGASPLQVIVPGVLSLASLLCVALFDAIFAPLLNPMLMPNDAAGDVTTPLILGGLAFIGGGILYATREVWGRTIQAPQPQPLLPL